MKVLMGFLGMIMVIVLIPLYGLSYTVNYSYDDAGRLIKATYDQEKSISYTYDNAGNLLNRTIADACLNHGDVDANGQLTAQDAQTAFNIVMGFYTPTPEENCAADCSGDSDVTAGDAQAIFTHVIYGGACADPIPTN